MKVICIASHHTGDKGPVLQFGQVLRVRSTMEDAGTLYYEFKEIPNWAYSVEGFLPISGRCEVKMLARRRKKASLLRRLATQLTIGFKLL